MKEIKTIIKILFSTLYVLLLGIFYALNITFLTFFGTAYNKLCFYYKIRKIDNTTKKLLKKLYHEKTSIPNMLKNLVKEKNNSIIIKQ